jgi:transcriptional regulator with XRE-family HTH domain
MWTVPNYEVSDLTRLIASRIRGLMAQHGVKQAEMAAAIGVSQSQLSKMIRGVRPIDIDQLDGMCLALGTDLYSLIKEAEDTLSNLDAEPNARLIFVDDGVRLAEPMNTEGWGNGPVIPLPAGRSSLQAAEDLPAEWKLTNVGPLSDDELRNVDIEELRKSDHALVAGDDQTTDDEDDVTP